jgi:adenylate cyclase
LDTVRVKGRNQALRVYELAALSAHLADPQAALIANYAEGLAHWRAGEFDHAEKCFGRSAETDRPAAIFRERAREAAAHSPGAEWEPIRTLQEK